MTYQARPAVRNDSRHYVNLELTALLGRKLEVSISRKHLTVAVSVYANPTPVGVQPMLAYTTGSLLDVAPKTLRIVPPSQPEFHHALWVDASAFDLDAAEVEPLRAFLAEFTPTHLENRS